MRRENVEFQKHLQNVFIAVKECVPGVYFNCSFFACNSDNDLDSKYVTITVLYYVL